MDTNEVNIINRCQQGESQAFGWLYNRYVKKIYNFIYYKTMHQETAEDLTSQTFIKALNNLAGFDPGKGSFSAWLYQIARNNVIDHYRTTHPTQDIDSVWDLSDGTELEQEVDQRLTLEKVQGYLQQLNNSQREIIIMRLWDNLNYQEIAQITGQSEANCRMIVSRGLKKIQTGILALILIITSILWIN